VGWRSARPDLACVDRAGAPVGDDTVCLELPEVADGLDRMQEEVHALGAAWDGVVFHPTEATPLRFNPATAAAFRADTGGELAAQPDEALLPWFNERWARALARWMAAWQRRRPGLDAIAFNCWWTNADPAVYARLLPATARVCVWDYDRDLARWRDRTLVRWAGALDPARLVVMPSSGGYPDHGRPPTDEALRGVDRLLSLALHLKVRETVLFAGWGAGPAEEQALDRALLAAASGALAPPTDGLLDALDADYEATRASLKI